jgi:hypothetical protein
VVEGSSTGGDLKFETALLDGRKYFFLNPVTIAVRALHFGRYGTDAESPRLSPLFVGSPALVRGYEAASFGAGDCTFVPSDPTACPEVDRLSGSRPGRRERRGEGAAVRDRGIRHLQEPLPAAGRGRLRGRRGGLERGGAPRAALGPEHGRPRAGGLRRRGRAHRPGGILVLEAYWAWPFQRREGGPEFGLLFSPGW